MTDVFRRVVCAIDESLESVEAARQVARLVPRSSRLALVCVARPLSVTRPGRGVLTAPNVRAARLGVERARIRIAELERARVSVLEGAPVPTLLAALDREEATLVAVGIHHGRAAGYALGSVASALLRDAGCSVYFGRGRFGVTRLPRRIVVGFDGSEEAYAAVAAAGDLAARLPGELTALVARGGTQLPSGLVERGLDAFPELRLTESSRSPLEALVSAPADLIVVGSRGRHGVRTLGSVSERVAHRARCSVLVVRRPAAGV